MDTATNEEESAGRDWIAAMRAGNFARAWEIGDRDLAAVGRADLAKHEGPRHLQRIWRGEPLDGRRVLVRCYHGLGDTIQFARFLSPLRAIASEVVLWCQPELLSLMTTIEGIDRILPLHDGAPDVDFDADIEIMEIPHAIRASREQIEMPSPYLRTVQKKVPAGSTAGGSLSIGLVWDVGDWQRWRIVPPRLLKQLNCPGVQLYSLQRGGAAEAASEIGAIDISTPDIDVLARRLQMLDLCICPDTMVAHLSGALGRETWIMLHANCDWRWPASGSKSLWYPTVRLFRQRTTGDWQDVVGDVRTAIAEQAEHPFGTNEKLPLQRNIDGSEASEAIVPRER
jgi:hypothetical protein